jgi:hypothetical protein
MSNKGNSFPSQISGWQPIAQSVRADPGSVSLPCQIAFDWLPAVQNSRATFNVRVERGEQTSAISFEVDLRKLSAAKLRRLENFLARRHAGLTSSVEVAGTLTSLLDSSLQQTQPSLQRQERRTLVRELLLVRKGGRYGR